jgi:preprotein translocase subunit YajC
LHQLEHYPVEIVVLVIFMLVIAAYWAMVVFPRQRDFQKRQQMARTLSAGDEIITYGGIIGKVQAIDGAMGVAHVEIANGVTVQVVTAAIMQRYDRDEIARHAQMGPGAAEPTAAPAGDQV